MKHTVTPKGAYQMFVVEGPCGTFAVKWRPDADRLAELLDIAAQSLVQPKCIDEWACMMPGDCVRHGKCLMREDATKRDAIPTGRESDTQRHE